MAFEENGGGMNYSMPVAPAYAGGGFGGLGGDNGWWIILLLLAFNGGWGMGGFGGGMMWPMMMGGMGGFGMDYLYPWLNNSQHISDGFRDQMLQTSITSVGDKITSGFGDIQTQLCGGFSGVNASIANSAAQAEIAANGRQMASMNQNFALQSTLQNGFCDNRAGIADLKYTVATENCADRNALAEGVRDIIAAQTAGFQSLKDQLYAERVERKDDTIAQLRQELLFSRGKDSQDVQTAQIVNDVYNRLSQCPVGTVPVFGNQPIWTCASNVASNNGCGCGCGNL